jgi:pimeloyl-ACP methyl ester carboxylesterase
VYIEGDGMAWISRDQLSNNPTPVRPVALELASMDSSVNILYIARPCQYLWPQSMSNCSSDYWNNKRGSEEVISAINQVITIVKAKEGFLSIKLIGYSGGGGIAAMITNRRDDVEKLVTIAGNLNYDLFTKIHKLTPISGSIDPITIAKQIASTPQIHYVGGADKIIPEQIARSFSDKVVVVKGVTHASWAEKWSEVVSKVFP